MRLGPASPMWRPRLTGSSSRLRLLLRFISSIPLVFRLAGVASAAQAADNPIQIENRKPGSPEWQLGRPGFSVSTDAGGEIKGYASQASVNKGQTLSVHVSVSRP